MRYVSIISKKPNEPAKLISSGNITEATFQQALQLDVYFDAYSLQLNNFKTLTTCCYTENNSKSDYFIVYYIDIFDQPQTQHFDI